LSTIFTKWGLPAWVKVDNGRPLGDPTLDTIPPLALWLVGIGVDVYYNRPRTPQQNAKVERCQETMSRWTEYKSCKDHNELQLRLMEESRFYNEDFKDRRKSNTTRKERFVDLEHTGRVFDPEAFNFNRVLEYIAKRHWKRRVATMGQISHFGQRFSVGKSYAKQTVMIKMDAKENKWVVTDQRGEVIKRQPTKISKEELKAL